MGGRVRVRLLEDEGGAQEGEGEGMPAAGTSEERTAVADGEAEPPRCYRWGSRPGWTWCRRARRRTGRGWRRLRHRSRRGSSRRCRGAG